MKTINEPKKLNTKQLWTLLSIFTHNELKAMAKEIKAPVGRNKTATIVSLVDHRETLGNCSLALDISK